MTANRTAYRAERLLYATLIVVSVGYLAAYLIVALARMGFPYELEWREGGSVDHVARILAGQPLYVAPSLDFVPYTYTPLYFYLSAAVARLLGASLVPLRLVSFGSSLAVFVLLFLFVRRETGSASHGLVATGLFAATFRLAGAWLDIARVDSLYLALTLAGLYLVRFRQNSWGQGAAGLLAALAFLTKQTALVMVAPVMLWALWSYRRRGAIFPGVTLALVAASTLWLNWASGGWYVRYVFEMAGSHQIVATMWVQFWTRDLANLFVTALFALAFFLLRRPGRERRAEATLFYLAALGGGLAASWSSRLSNGGYNNALLPAFAWLSVLFALGLRALRPALATVRRDPHGLLAVYALVVCLIQFATLRYNPLAQIPSRQDWDAGARLVQALSALPGDVFMPAHGYLPVLAGKKSFGSGMALFDMQTAGPARDRLVEETRRALRERRFAALVVDQPTCWFSDVWYPEVNQYYPRRTFLSLDEGALWPLTGMRTRPAWLCFPADVAAPLPIDGSARFRPGFGEEGR